MKRNVAIGLIAAMLVTAAGVTALRWNGALWPPAAPPGATAPGPGPAAKAPAPQPAPSAGPVAPSFDVVRVNPQGETVIAGRAAPNAEVTILDRGKPIGQATANGDGEWVFMPKEPLPPGNHELSLTARSRDGGSSTSSDGVVAMTVPQRTHPGTGAPSEGLAVLVPRQGGGPARALQLPREAAGSRHKLVLDVIEYDASGKVQLLGRAEPGAEIRAYLDEHPEGTGKATAPGGGWSVILDQPVPVGRYRLRLEALDGQGQRLAQIALDFGRVAPPEGAVAVDIQPGNNLWRIAQRSYGDGLRYTEIYQANKALIRDPNLIYPGQIVAVPSKAR